MRMLIASVYDKGAEAYMRPLFFRSEGEAMRSWLDAVNDPESVFSKHPEDYILMQVGYWDEDNGVLESVMEQDAFVVSALSVYDHSKVRLVDEAPRAEESK